MSEVVFDVSEKDFEREVIERSKTAPVVVDFWAEWCGPCRQLGPVLERECESREGVFLAKVNVDENQRLAMRYQVSGIPAVKAFRDGKVVSEFVGAQPVKEVKRFFDLLRPSEADVALSSGRDLLAQRKFSEAKEAFEEALSLNPRLDEARLGLVGALLSSGKLEEAKAQVEKLAAGTTERAQADALLMKASFVQDAAQGEIDPLVSAVEAAPKDSALRWSLACRYAAEDEYEPALREFLEIVKQDRKFKDDGARKAMLAIFALLGQDELVSLYRRRLSLALF